jgi:hypothetical protein
MKSFWITFEDGSKGCCEGNSQKDAERIAAKLTKKTVRESTCLPYPASPVIWQFDHPVDGKCPRFCYTPEQCKGKTACPRNPCCTS